MSILISYDCCNKLPYITPELHSPVTDLEVSKLQNSLGQVTLFSLYSDSAAPLYPLGNAAIQMTVSSCTFFYAKADVTSGQRAQVERERLYLNAVASLSFIMAPPTGVGNTWTTSVFLFSH